MPEKYVVGIDIGTGSARVGLFDLKGRLIAQASRKIQIWKPRPHFVEQSSNDIWRAACESVREALEKAAVPAGSISGISFDATCSLVALGPEDEPVTVSPDGDPEQNIIVWMDHRATEQAKRINGGGHEVLKYVGGALSPEQEPPKLLWIKENLPESWNRAALFLDLADFLTYRATGKDVRSLCTAVCKWTYLGHEKRWDRSFFEQNGLTELLDKKKIGEDVRAMGEPLGTLTEKSAAELGLTTATKVAVGIIDAHAGGIGMAGCYFESAPKQEELESQLALIGGTSSCHMAVSTEPKYIKGIWGPYYSAMIPGMWLTEGGQSATGALLDYMIRENSRYPEMLAKAENQGLSIYDYFNNFVDTVKKREDKGAEITAGIQILPYFLGNRSPHADPGARGMIAGLTLDIDEETIAIRYYATIQAIAYGTRHIIEEMNRAGYSIKRILACGGGTKNPLWMQEHADITGCEIVVPEEPEAVLLGSAILGAVGAGEYGSIIEASAAMARPGQSYKPDQSQAGFHASKYNVLHRMYDCWKQFQYYMTAF